MIDFYESNGHNICVIDSDVCDQEVLDSIDFDSIKIGDPLYTKDGLSIGEVHHINDKYITIAGEEFINANL